MSSSLDLNFDGAISYLAGRQFRKDAFDLKRGRFSSYRSACYSWTEGLAAASVVLAVVESFLAIILIFMFAYEITTRQHADWIPITGIFLAVMAPSLFVWRMMRISSSDHQDWFVWDNDKIKAGSSSIRSLKTSTKYITRKEVYYGLGACLVFLAAIREEFDQLVRTTGNAKFAACAMSVESAYNHVYETFAYTQLYASNQMRENSQVEWLTPVLEKAVRATDLANSLIELSTRSSLTSAQLIGSAHIDILLNDVEAARLKLEALDEVSASSMLERGSFNSN